MIDAPITAILTGVFAGMLVMLSVPISLRRIATKTSMGLGTDDLLQRLIRAQGNFVEFAPLGLIAIFMVETGCAPAPRVWLVGGLLLAGRLTHAAGMIAGILPGRTVGMVLTYVSLVSSAGFLVSRAF